MTSTGASTARSTITSTTLTRMRECAVTDRAELDRLLDDNFLAHVGMADDQGGVVVIPSAVLFGSFTRLAEPDVPGALDLFTEHLMPGRTSEVRPKNRRELAATMVLSMPIGSWSMKTSTDWPTDAPDDVAGHAWAGVIPFDTRRLGDPLPAPDLRPGIPVPNSVHAMTARHDRPDR